jgi:3-methylfumaryl-CoA hydratase
MDDIHEVTELITTGPAEYSYRLVAPLYEDQGLVVSATPEGGTIGVSCRDASGRVTATGVIRLV